MRTRHVLPLTAVLLLAAGTLRAAPGPPPGPPPDPPDHLSPALIERLVDELKLDAAKRQKIRDLVFESRKQAIELRAQMQTLRLELHQALTAEPPNRPEVLKLADRMGANHTQLLRNRMTLLLDVAGMLTPEQRAKAHALAREKGAQIWRKWSGWGGRGGGMGRHKGMPGAGGPGPGDLD
jgi:Spy/CpxP family protein refolding chaperone